VLVVFQELGIYTVPAFLFLSGAFFAYAVQNRSLRGSYKTVLANVLSTLWPYLVWSLVFYLVTGLLLGDVMAPLQIAKNLVVGYPFNFIPILLVFFVLAPVISLVSRRFPLLALGGILLVQLLEALIVDPTTFGFVVHLPHWMNYLGMPVIRSEFAVWGIFFPLGMVYQQHMQWITQTMRKLVLGIAIFTILFYVLDVLNVLNIFHFPLALALCPIFGLLLTPVIRRDAIPFYKTVEMVGKRSYGLYLTNLIIITVVLFAIHQVAAGLIGVYLVMIPLLFCVVLLISIGMMMLIERPPQRVVYRYLFG
jgi:peptidoglycan/LPS O-acetylase OafA/YrhL